MPKQPAFLLNVPAPFIDADHPYGWAPNLDAQDPDELAALADVFESIGRYARCKARAMTHRLDGRIAIALDSEREADRIYRRLPKWARW